MSDDQIDAVARIRRCKDHYQTLGLDKNASDADIRKAYRKLALQFHPDKNQADGATEAFQKVGTAFAILSDPAKRRQYDVYGSEEGRTRHRTSNYDSRYEGPEPDISPEDLFNMFFGGAGGFAGTQTVYANGRFYRTTNRFQQQQHQHHQHEPNGASVLLQMMPILVLIGLSLMSSLFVSDPAYSLVRTGKYNIERKTSNLEVPYFVRESFEKDYKGNLRRVEAQVEEDFITNLRGSCYRERNYKESMIWRARSFRDIALEEKAKSLKTPSCDHLRKLSQEFILW